MRDSVAVSWTRPSIFGSIAQQTMPFPAKVDFIPANSEGDVIQIKGDGVSWKGLSTHQMQYWAYCFCSPLASVIDRCADADINGYIQILKENDNVSNSAIARRVKKLLNKPNPLQTYYEYRAQQVTYKKTYGYSLVYSMGVIGNDRTMSSYLWNLNPYYCNPVRNNNFDIFKDPNPIASWDVTIFGKTYNIPADKILILKDSFHARQLDDLGIPLSKISGLDWAISNICASMEADNVLLRKKGPLGFISQDSTRDPVAGYVSLTPKEKLEIQNDLSKYGLTWSQWQYVVTRHLLKWNPMSFNVRDLQTKETIREGIDMICDRFNYPAELMSGKNATYENRTSAEIYFLNSAAIPQNVRDYHSITMWFEMEAEYIYCNFEDYPALMDARVAQGESQRYSTEAYQLQFYDGAIHLNQYRQKIGDDTVEGEDWYYNSPEYKAKYGTKDIAPKSTPVKA